MDIMSYLLKCLEIDTEVITTNKMDLDLELRCTDLLLTLLESGGADSYLSGPSGRYSLDLENYRGTTKI